MVVWLSAHGRGTRSWTGRSNRRVHGLGRLGAWRWIRSEVPYALAASFASAHASAGSVWMVVFSRSRLVSSLSTSTHPDIFHHPPIR